MKIIIPMSGFGERFRREGYDVPKPLIVVDNKPIIAHVIDLFPNETDFIFICNQDHLSNKDYKMAEILNHYCPTGKIIGIEPHKLGPVYAVSKVYDLIDSGEQVIVNYADFTCYWDYEGFKKHVADTQCAGCIPAYKGFHPHSIHSHYYAYMKTNGEQVLDIQEKQPYTDNPKAEYASSGTYYFSKGSLLIKYFTEMMEAGVTVSDEYYVSMVYKFMLKDNLPVTVYDLAHFMQWGTPGDLEEYQYWAKTFDAIIQNKNTTKAKHKGAVLIPMAGEGSRFKDQGYELPKPAINVSGKPMFIQAVNDLPESDKYVFVIREDHQFENAVSQIIDKESINADVVKIKELTEGQAITCQQGINAININEPLTIGACDNGALYDSEEFNQIIDDNDVDIIVWGIRGYPGAIRNPEMYGWIEETDGVISSVSVKKPLSNTKNDPIIVGTFTFKKAKYFTDATNLMIKNNQRINNEFYVDTCINSAIEMGLKCMLFEVDHYLCWGSPDDMNTHNYWQSCFHKWKSHDYRLENDDDIPQDKLDDLKLSTN